MEYGPFSARRQGSATSVPLDSSVWIAGLAVSPIDGLIATIAQSYRVPLSTLDELFFKMQPMIGFELYTFGRE